MLVSGEAREEFAALSVQLDVKVRRPDWVRVPLRLGAAALDGAAEYSGNGDHLLVYDEESKSYVVWLRGAPGANHRLTLRVKSPLTLAGNQHKLALDLPSAATSKLALTVPGTEISVIAVPGGAKPEISSTEQASIISLLGIGGDFSLTWMDKAISASPADPVLESSGAILAKIDGRSVTTEATLQVRSFGGAFDHFHVRLPKGAVLTGAEQAGYTLSPKRRADEALIEVRLDKPTSEPVEIKLTTEHAFDVTKGELIELAGFQVLEAAPHRQGGQIAVLVSGDWQVIWEARSRVRQIDEPVEALRRRDLLAAFEFVGQPCSLTARIAARRSRISVDPEYVCHVDAYASHLEAKLKYAVRGAKVFALEIDMAGWEVDEVGPPGLIDAKLSPGAEDGHLRLLLAQPTVGDFEIELRAHRPHPDPSADLALSLPVFTDATAGPATLAVIPAQNVELNAKTDQFVALSPLRGSPSLPFADAAFGAQVFRMERPNAIYVATMSVRSQKIGVQVANTVDVRRTATSVTQRFDYQVLYEPVARLNFSAPRMLVADNRLTWFVDDERATAQLVGEDRGAGDGLRLELALPKPRIGVLQVVCRYDLSSDGIAPGASKQFSIPLLMPLEGEFGQNTLDIQCQAGLGIEAPPDRWKLIDQESTADAQHWRLAAAAAVNSASLSVVAADQPAPVAAIADRAWVQTWLTDHTRQDRAVFSISSTAPRVTVTLPEDADMEDAEVFLDGKAVYPAIKNARDLVFPWPTEPGPHVLDLRFRYLSRDDGVSANFRSPGFGGGVRVRRLYWQLIVPRDRHLLRFDDDLAPEFSWRFGGLFWARANRLGQADLEDWTDAIREPPPPEAVNDYLFSLIGESESPSVSLGRRSTIVFCGSVAVLGIALLAAYVPWLRQPTAIVVLGLLLLVVALAYPGPALLLGQGASVGILLAVFAAILRRALPQNAVKELPRSQPSSMIERSVTDTYSRPVSQGSHASIAAAMAVEQTGSESGAR
jgi:hypothetical protein